MAFCRPQAWWHMAQISADFKIEPAPHSRMATLKNGQAADRAMLLAGPCSHSLASPPSHLAPSPPSYHALKHMVHKVATSQVRPTHSALLAQLLPIGLGGLW